jgi:1-phosphofructokinase
VESGIHYVCISLGKEGIMLVDKYGVHSYAAEPADIKSLQGAGDALVAGICKAIYEKEEKKMAEYALKMAASTISLEGSRMGTL